MKTSDLRTGEYLGLSSNPKKTQVCFALRCVLETTATMRLTRGKLNPATQLQFSSSFVK